MAPKSASQFEEIRNKRRKEILDTARTLFANKGYTQTSISDIAQELSISKGLLYNYFSSKDELLMAVLEDAMNIGQDMMAKLQETSDPTEKVKFLIEQGFEWIVEHEEFSKTIMSLSLQVANFPAIKRMIDAKVDGYKTLMTQLFTELGFQNPEMEAYLFGALFDGIGLQYVTVGDRIDTETIKDFLLNKYCNFQKH